MKKVLSFAQCIILAVAFMASCTQLKPSPRKVLFVGVDGLASWCLEKAIDSIPDRIPNIIKLMEESSWTLEKRAVAPTSSAINWASTFMGVPTEMHGYNRWNSKESAFKPYAVGPNGMPSTVFTILKEQRPEAESVCIYDWYGIGYVIDTAAVSRHQCLKWDPDSLSSVDYTKQYCLPVIEQGMPDIFMFYLVDVDEAGHHFGWGSEEYYDAIVRFDEALGLMLDALDKSGQRESTVLIITSDHGGKKDKKHGTYNIEDILTPLLVNGPGFVPGQITHTVMQYDVAAITAKVLGLTVPEEWRGRSDFIPAIPRR
jgi:hypothetical protein